VFRIFYIPSLLLQLSFCCVIQLVRLLHYRANKFLHATYLKKQMSAIKRICMNVKYLIAICLLVMVVSCKKESAGLTNDLQGKWELMSYDGGWVGHLDYAPGNGNTYTFNGNNFTQQYKNPDTTIQTSGSFKIYKGKPCDFASEQTLIEFMNNSFPSSYSLTDGKLRIGSTECIADGGISTYIKIR
jgi:hypothetical protein